MRLLFGSEWMKLMAQTKAKVLLVIVWLSALVVSLGNLYFNGKAGFTLVDGSQMPLTMITLLGGLVLPLITFVVAVDATSLDHKSGTIKFALMAPVPRYQVYLSKYATLMVYNGLMLSGVMLISVVTNLGQWEALLGQLLVYLAAYLITLIPLGVVALWGMLMGSYLSSGLSLVIGIISLLALNVGRIFVPVLGALSPLAYMNLYSQIIYGHVGWQVLTSALLYLASYYIILITLNLQRFQSEEI